MKHLLAFSITILLCLMTPAEGEAGESIFLPSDPALSPDGTILAFAWTGDIWTANVEGGTARRLTSNTATDSQPCFSPDGTEIAFISTRDGSRQVYVMPSEGGAPERLTFHTAGYSLLEWYPDGKSLLTGGTRDYFHRDGQRLFRISPDQRGPDHLLFDASCGDAALSADAAKVLFTREGMTSWRKGYKGSRAGQIWLYDMPSKSYTKLLDHEWGSRSPCWKPDGKRFYYVDGRNKGFNLWEYDLSSNEQRQLTRFEDDSVMDPVISRDGSTIVFRHLFHFYRYHPGTDQAPRKIELLDDGDKLRVSTMRKTMKTAVQAAFSDDGLEVAFIAGGDLWVMDTELRDPRQITNTAWEESNPVFSPKSDALYFISDQGGQNDIWRAERKDPDRYWWQNEGFELVRITNDEAVESSLTFSPDGSRTAFVKGRGDLWIADQDLKNARMLFSSWNAPEYDWSPDGKWLVYAVSDNDFNRDIWVRPIDGSIEPYNLSRHPDNDSGPVWSPDGKAIAFTGRRLDTEVDIYYVWLTREDYEKSGRDRTMKKALEKMEKLRKKDKKKEKPQKTEPPYKEAKAEIEKILAMFEKVVEKYPEEKGGAALKKFLEKVKAIKDSVFEPETDKKKKDKPEVVIDFEDIHDRIRRISIPDSAERGLFWSHDSKKLAFSASINGKAGTYTVEFPEKLKPVFLTDKTGSSVRWLKEGNKIVWLSGGLPGSLSSSGKGETYTFSAQQEVDLPTRYRAGFIQAWRTMRDSYYDGRLNNRDWNSVRSKYEDWAARAPDDQIFATVVQLMLGELNGSHLGFSAMGSRRGRGGPPSRSEPETWTEETAHFGARFETEYTGPGWKIRDVLPDSPADQVKSRLHPGEVILKIEGKDVSPDMDPTLVLNGRRARDIRLTVRNTGGDTREVTIRPMSYRSLRGLLQAKWVKDCRAITDRNSGGTLGYLYVPGMNWPSFQEFEREIYAEGSGKDGLIIDVRNNGGGFTADHLLTVLCQPSHAITVGRGGEHGYPQDRRVYATWDKPVVVLCNQNSFSNAEIFSHAINSLKRGKVVGVPTAGGVISTGGRMIMDLGFLRMPFRGWFVITDGEDMELHGAVPHYTIWPQPGEMPQGKDVQLEKAIEVLRDDVKKAKAHPAPKYRQDLK